MSKYEIRNCPALQQTYYCNTHHSKCQGCTDCVMKQIVELCKEVNTKFYDSVHQRYLSPSKAKFARQILKLLDIEEIE